MNKIYIVFNDFEEPNWDMCCVDGGQCEAVAVFQTKKDAEDFVAKYNVRHVGDFNTELIDLRVECCEFGETLPMTMFREVYGF